MARTIKDGLPYLTISIRDLWVKKPSGFIVVMLNETSNHFSNEEKYMNYPDYNDHKEKHDLYVNTITAFYEKVKNEKIFFSLVVTNFLKTWLTNHIKGTDQNYASYAHNI
ncbi:hemerythrin domain-containing protein [Marinilabilia sp.]|uniref:hemerythrin domain-containing protein n=1 Tax=Marinilabilia sp. TaxID=2021252 RepID=UPI0025C5FBE1|nr:hemerythrin domain-containing protein [Marinilabilia sp.]